MLMMTNKLFQYDKKVWEDAETSHTWQFGILKNHSLLWVRYEYPSSQVWMSGGLHISFSLFGSSLFGVDFETNSWSFSFNFFTEYFEGWKYD
jgi:hypothetical protein